MEDLLNQLFPNWKFWAELSGLLGIVISLIGFIITICGIKKVRSELKRGINKVNIIADLSAALSKMDEIVRLQDAGQWVLLSERYTELKRLLLSIGSSDIEFIEEHKTFIQGATVQCKTSLSTIKRALQKGSTPDPVRLNTVISDQSDQIHQILVAVKREI